MTEEKFIGELDWNDNVVVHSQVYSDRLWTTIARVRGTPFANTLNFVVAQTPGALDLLRGLKFRLFAPPETLNAWSPYMVAEFCAIKERKNSSPRRNEPMYDLSPKNRRTRR